MDRFTNTRPDVVPAPLAKCVKSRATGILGVASTRLEARPLRLLLTALAVAVDRPHLEDIDLAVAAAR